MSDSRYKGVMNQEQHQEEAQALMEGKFKQLHVFSVDLGKTGAVKGFGNDQGMMEIEGCGIVALPFYMNNDGTILISQTDWPVMVRFNHPENPWVPIGMPKAGKYFGTGNQFNVPVSYALTIGRFWMNVPTLPGSLTGGVGPPNPGSICYFAVVRGVSIYSAANSFGPEITNYVIPTWTSLR